MSEATPFSVHDSNDSTGFLLWQVTAIWQRKIAAVLRPHDLTQVQFALLASLLWLSKNETQITQVMLAKHAKLDIMMTSQVLRTLEAKGLIERHPHPIDTRAKLLTLTSEGQNRTWHAVPDVEKADAEFFSALGTEQTQFNQSLRSLLEL